VRIGVVVEWRWDLKKDLQDSDKKSKKENKDNKKESEDGTGKS